MESERAEKIALELNFQSCTGRAKPYLFFLDFCFINKFFPLSH